MSSPSQAGGAQDSFSQPENSEDLGRSLVKGLNLQVGKHGSIKSLQLSVPGANCARETGLLDQAIVVHSNRALEIAKVLDELQFSCCQLAVRLELRDREIEKGPANARVQVHVDLEHLLVRLVAGCLEGITQD